MNKLPTPSLSLLATLVAATFSLSSLSAAEPEKVLAALELPNDPSILSGFQTVYVGANAVQTEAEAETNMAMIRKYEIKHVGGNRLLARIEFDQVPTKEETTFYHFYLDTDNDPATGRQGSAQGIDLMLTVMSGRVGLGLYNPALTPTNSVARAVFDGKVLYATIETPLPSAGENIPLAGWVLSQRFTPPKSAASDPKAHFFVPRGKVGVVPLTSVREAAVL